MTRSILLLGVVLLTAGCRQDLTIEAVSESGLREAYKECLDWPRNTENAEMRLACTAAVYGGVLK